MTADNTLGKLDVVLSAFDDDDYEDPTYDGDDPDWEELDEDGNRAESTKKIRKVQQLPEKHAIIYKHATDLYLQGDYEKALAEFRDIGKAVKNFAPLYGVMADCSLNLERMEEAFQHCKTAVRLDGRYVEAWTRLVELAEALGLEEDLLVGLKNLVRLTAHKPEVVIPHLRRLLAIGDSSDAASTVKNKTKLFLAEYATGNRDCFQLAMEVYLLLISEKKHETAVEFFDSFIPEAMSSGESVPEFILASYVEVLVHTKQGDRIPPVLLGFNVMQIVGPASGTFELTSAKKVTVRPETYLPLVAATCLVMVDFDCFPAVEALFKEQVLGCAEFPKSALFLDLAVALLNKSLPGPARLLLENLKKSQETQTPEFYYQLGLAMEHYGDAKQALDAFNRAVSLKPTFRQARYRIRRLGLPIPSTAHLGTTENRARTIMIQNKIFEEYCAVKDKNDKPLILRLAVDLLTSTFAHIEEGINPEKFLYGIPSPARMDVALQQYLLYAPSIATDDIPLEDFWNVAMHGCAVAFELRNWEDFLVIAFYALCTADFRSSVEKITILKQTLLVVGFYMHKLPFCGRYVRDDMIIRRKTYNPRWIWHLFQMYAADLRMTVPLVKWARRIGQYGYSRELTMIRANDSIRRENYRHGLSLYLLIASNDGGVETTTWNVLLMIGILYVNLSAQFHVTHRSRIYSTGMVFLEKYACRRGICPEVMYNKARAAQVYGDLAEAIRLYNECLRLSRTTIVVEGPQHWPYVDFTYEAAYNLRAAHLTLKQPAAVEDMYASTMDWSYLKERLKPRPQDDFPPRSEKPR